MNHLQQEIHSASFTYTEASDTYRFTDPINGEVLEPDQIPSGLLMDGRLAAGYNFLQENAVSIEGKVVLSRHADASDIASYDLLSDAEHYGVVFFEGIGWKESDVTDFHKMTHATRDQVKVSQRMADLISDSDFLKAKWQQLYGSRVNIQFADIADTEQPVDQMLLEWDSLWKELHDTAGDSTGHKRAAALAAIGYNNYREWYMLGMLGNRLAKATNEGENPSFVFLVGSTHKNILNKLKLLGVNAEKQQIDHETSRGNSLLKDALGRLSLSGIELETIYK